VYDAPCCPVRLQVVRLYAVLNHPPNLCKDSTSCQLIVPGAHCGRSHDVYLVSLGSLHGVAPKGKWVVVASARVEGSTDGLDALGVAKRELAAVMPLLKPTRKLFAEVTPYYEPDEDAQLDNMVVMSSCDESSYFDSVEADVAQAFERVTGETISSVRR
jgi:Rab GDP dissociation inhibitor